MILARASHKLTPMRLALLLVPLLAAACSAAPPPSGSTTVADPGSVLVVVDPPPAATTSVEVAAPSPSARGDLEWAIFGDTPTVAWAPDGVRLAIANQVNYLNAPAASGQAGIDVVHVETGKRTRVHEGPGYHPVWLGGDQMAFGCSTYECNDAGQGIYLLDLGKRARLALKHGAYHTRAGKDGGVIFFSGFPEYEGWMSWDLRSAKPKRISGPENSWQAPAAPLADQCPTKVGERRVEQRGEQVFVVDTATGSRHAVIDAPPWYLAWPENRGAIQPCLSPDGRFVVYFSQRGGAGLVGVRQLDAP
ncbi:hypothetical protein [Polyangium mundeleinium]|uniref:Uncharacterized protein n=1 Tax=Polyangium mundeleinium TaxID=2995306 RepID=A0ABT5EMQ0_9BACT|nr:hypothetical protein [Polyangium mundeleinium]MDC0743104.1 hypothetical protein [Polyangium mundeleinium]